MSKINVAIVGVRGIPNNYGGFETLAEYLALHLSSEVNLSVYCSSVDMPTRMKTHFGARLIYVPISSHGAWGILYDTISLIHALFSNKKILILGFGCGLILPFLGMFTDRFIVNVGGLDAQRNKWSSWKQRIIKISEKNLLTRCSTVISDNIGIRDYITREYHRDSVLIEYGGDQAKKIAVTEAMSERYPFLRSEYAFIVTRIQRDNNIEMILEAFSGQQRLPLVMVGNWNGSEYGAIVRGKFRDHDQLILLDAIYDREVLDVLRSNCTVYIHGHSAGGTNPSLVEAMFLGLPVFAFASGFNEYTTEHSAVYFKNEAELRGLIDSLRERELQTIGGTLQQIARRRYRWEDVSKKYLQLFQIKAKHD